MSEGPQDSPFPGTARRRRPAPGPQTRPLQRIDSEVAQPIQRARPMAPTAPSVASAFDFAVAPDRNTGQAGYGRRADAGATLQPPPAAEVFPGRGDSRTPPPRPPAPVAQGFQLPRRPRSSTVAGALVVLIVLGAAAFGVHHVASGGSQDPDIAVANGTPGGQAGAPAPVLPSPSAKPSTEAKEIRRTGAASKVKLGIFRSTSPNGVRSFERWLGRDVDYVVDFSSRGTWKEISSPTYMINAWRNSGHRMVYSVALLPGNNTATIKAGARGDYDAYYRTLAQHLVAGGQEDAILRLGWEFNLKGWRWSTDNPKEFISYWRHIVTAMRSVPGQKLKFDWNPNVGDTPYEAYKYYPGGKYVDYVGVDVYDVSWDAKTYPYEADCSAVCRERRQAAVWDRLLHGRYGLVYWSDFARSKGKPMSIPEWGLWERPDGHGGGDNPLFIKEMFAFIDDPQNRVAYQGYLDVDVNDGNHRLTTLKKAGKAYKRLFGDTR